MGLDLDALEEAELPPAARRLYCNRTLNLRSIKAIGFDMDYTLIHYRVEKWEQHAYEAARRELAGRGWPVAELTFDPEFATLGLVLDLELGNLLKANRFGFVTKAMHGTRALSFEEQRAIYGRVVIDLARPRWVFLNTFFSLSEASLYAQVVDLLDAGRIGGRALGYRELYGAVREALDAVHLEGALKAEIARDPSAFVELDEELPRALLDLRQAGKRLFVITNSEWSYTRSLMSFAFDRFLRSDRSWRDLFDLVIVAARKPDFFTGRNPPFRVVDEERGLLEPFHGKLTDGGVFFGGNARSVEVDFELDGEEILYVGDHIFSDVHVSKDVLRWRTCLVVRQLERDLEALERFKPQQAELTALMQEKTLLEHRYSLLRLALQRLDAGEPGDATASAIRERLHRLKASLLALDERIAPLARQSGTLSNERWGLLMRAGNDKSHLARQVESYADVYTSRVSNLLHQTPFVYVRAPRGSLPHDSGPAGGA